MPFYQSFLQDNLASVSAQIYFMLCCFTTCRLYTGDLVIDWLSQYIYLNFVWFVYLFAFITDLS